MYNRIVIALMAGVIALDRYFKNKSERLGVSKASPNKRVYFDNVHNRGIALNIMDSDPEFVKSFTAVITGVIGAFFAGAIIGGKSRLRVLGLGLALSGAASNLFDRVKFGYVVDFLAINLPIKGIKKIVFNIADFSVIFGALALQLASMLTTNEGINTELDKVVSDDI